MIVPWKVVGAVALVLGGFGIAWQVQDWRYGKQQAEQGKRLALEQRLAASDKTHFEKMTNAQKNQALLRDRLATSDLRLSVLLDAGSTGGCSVPATAGAGSVDHAAVRARLDPAHAQRIIAITDEGDRGLIALQACQDYVRSVSRCWGKWSLNGLSPFRILIWVVSSLISLPFAINSQFLLVSISVALRFASATTDFTAAS